MVCLVLSAKHQSILCYDYHEKFLTALVLTTVLNLLYFECSLTFYITFDNLIMRREHNVWLYSLTIIYFHLVKAVLETHICSRKNPQGGPPEQRDGCGLILTNHFSWLHPPFTDCCLTMPLPPQSHFIKLHKAN